VTLNFIELQSVEIERESTVSIVYHLMNHGRNEIIHHLNGVVTAVSKEKCVDAIVISKRFRLCSMWERKINTPEYDQWSQNHKCRINHTMSSGAMESSGAIELFQ